jgi:peptide deformylase
VSLLEIRRWPDPILSRVCEPVRDPNSVRSLADDMLQTMYAAPGRGLAAPQVGHPLRLFVMDVAWKDGPPQPFICVNPEIVETAPDRVIGSEGCLSIPGVTAEVPRAPWITSCVGQRPTVQISNSAWKARRRSARSMSRITWTVIVTFDRVPPEARRALEAEYAG